MSDVTIPRLIRDTRASLGEGPVWFGDRAILSYVDINGQAVHSYDPASLAHRTVQLADRPGFIVPTRDGRAIVGAENRLFFMDGEVVGDQLAAIEMPHHNRINDATVDSHGRLWFGTMDADERRPTGDIYCWSGGRLTKMNCPAVVTNGPAMPPDGKTLYHVDSVDRSIWRHDVQADRDGVPILENRQLFVRLGVDEGYPDGIVFDSAGCLWVGLWDGWGVNRYDTDGNLMMHIALPCQRVTKVAFGGDHFSTAYITTARCGLSADQLEKQPLAGGLFAFDAPVAGLQMPSMIV